MWKNSAAVFMLIYLIYIDSGPQFFVTREIAELAADVVLTSVGSLQHQLALVGEL